MEGGGGREVELRGMQQHHRQQQQEQRGGTKPQHPPPQQPQKCPRCDSLNTKFCYYNNYSLTQPRYFCKTCRRYWTQGGTLRNVPVGGGCRKGKRLKRSSSPSSDDLNTPTSTAPLRSKAIDNITSSPLVPIAAVSGTALPQPSMYYPGGGFLSSLAGFHSFNQPLHVGGEFGVGGSNLSLLQGFSLPFHHLQQQQHEQHQQLYLHDLNMGTSDVIEEKVQPNRPSTSHQEWSQSYPNSSEATGYWSNSTNTNTNTSTTSTLGASLNSTHWTDHLQGYGGPPPPPPPPPQQQPPSTTTSSTPAFL